MLRFTRKYHCAASPLPVVKGLLIERPAAHPGVVTVTLNHSKSKNSISLEMYKGIGATFDLAGKDKSIKAVVLSGSGDWYSSGNNLTNFTREINWPHYMAKDAGELLQVFVDSFINCKKPILTAVNGPAIGIMVTTLRLTDYVACTPDATFYTPFAKLAQAPEGCSTYLFPKVLGRELSRKMLKENYTMSSDEALQSKFVDAVVPRDQLQAHVLAIADDIANGRRPPTRFCLDEKENDLLKSVNHDECENLRAAWTSTECFAALEKFMAEKGNKKGAMLMKFVIATKPLWDHVKPRY